MIIVYKLLISLSSLLWDKTVISHGNMCHNENKVRDFQG